MLGLNIVCLSLCNIFLSGIEMVFLSMYSFRCLGSIKITFSTLSDVLYADVVPEFCGIICFSTDIRRISDTTFRPPDSGSCVCSEEETTLSFSSTLSRPRQLRLTHLNEVIPPARILSLLNLNSSHDV